MVKKKKKNKFKCLKNYFITSLEKVLPQKSNTINNTIFFLVFKIISEMSLSQLTNARLI